MAIIDINIMKFSHFAPAALALAAAGVAWVPSASALEMAPAPARSEIRAELAGFDTVRLVGEDAVVEHKRKHKHKHHYRHHRGHDDDYPAYRSGYRHGYDAPVRRDTRVWRGRDGRYYCRRDDGSTGLLVGAGVGALAGHELAGRGGDRTLGAILGAAGGAILGRAIDRSDMRCR